MNLKRLWATTVTIFALSVFGPRSSGVWAQEQAACRAKPATSTPPPGDPRATPGFSARAVGWEWIENSLGQDPCLIISKLSAACRGSATFSFPPVNGTQSYVSPRRDGTSNTDIRCDRDSVMYSLYMGCTACQGGVIYSWVRWIGQCDEVHVGEYPHDIPQGTAIPPWAFFNITSLPSQTYNDTVAIAVGRYPEATPRIIGTGSGKPDPTGSGGSSDGGSKTGAIAGGVVGGVVSFLILTLGAFWHLRWRNGRNQVSEHDKGELVPSTPGPARETLPYYTYYNPDDPSTYPPPMADGQRSSTFVGPFSPLRGPQVQGLHSDISKPLLGN